MHVRSVFSVNSSFLFLLFIFGSKLGRRGRKLTNTGTIGASTHNHFRAHQSSEPIQLTPHWSFYSFFMIQYLNSVKLEYYYKNGPAYLYKFVIGHFPMSSEAGNHFHGIKLTNM
ncbi:unnamed protein product [Prunus armeniaca]